MYRLYLLPTMLINIVIIFVPACLTVVLAFYNWDGISTPMFVGLDNFRALAGDRVFWMALKNNIWTLIFLTIPMLMSLLAASMLLIARRGSNVFQIIYFLPVVIATVITARVWQGMIYSPVTGVFAILKKYGMPIPNPLTQPHMSLFGVATVDLWHWWGFLCVIRGPVADRMLISSADGGNSINDAVRQAYYLANLGLQLAGGKTLPAPKGGAQFHFSLPGSQHGFRPQDDVRAPAAMRVENVEFEGDRALAIKYEALGPSQVAAVTTPTFSPREILKMRTYDLMATPLLYPGQVLKARVKAPDDNHGDVEVRLRIRVYDGKDELNDVDGPVTSIARGQEALLEWVLPDTDGQPIGEVGFVVTTAGRRSDGQIVVDYFRRDGTPELSLRRPNGNGNFWRMAWVNGTSFFSKNFPTTFRISQAIGEGIIIHGTRQWTNYVTTSDVTVHLGNYGGIAVRAQGLRRYYGARVTRDRKMQIVKVRDDEIKVLAEASFDTEFEKNIAMKVTADGPRITFEADGKSISADDNGPEAFIDGGIGLLVHEGALSSNEIRVGAV